MKDGEKFSALKVLEPPAMPIKVGDGRVTLAVPMVGSLAIAYLGE